MTGPPELATAPHFPDAACRRPDVDPAWWWAQAAGSERTETQRAAKADIARAVAVCRTCPHLDDCRTHAIAHEAHGVWGGTTEGERHRERKARGIKVPSRSIDHGTEAGAKQHRRRGEKPCRICLEAVNAAESERRKRRRAS